jgi:ATP-dependent Clp protease ATP-binding subunit ClpC
MSKRSLRVYFVTHWDGHLSGILLRRWDALFDKPPPAAYGASEEEVFAELEVEVQERAVEEKSLERYLWEESFEVRRAAVTIFPQTAVKKQPVVGKKRVPLRLSYAACKMKSGAYRVMLPRFGFWMMVEDLEVAAETLRSLVSAALLGERPRWVYDFRREGDEYVKEWSPALLDRGGAKDDEEREDPEAERPTLRAVAEELVERAARHKLAPVIGDDPGLRDQHDSLRRSPPPSLLLVGPSGVGKSTWVRRLARLFLEWRRQDKNRHVPRIYRTSGDRIIAGMVYLGQWQERCFKLIEELSHEGDYLYVDRLVSIMQIQSDGGSIASLLAPSLQAEALSLIAECSEAELEHYRRRSPAFLSSFTIVRLRETPAGEMPKLLAQYAARKLPGVDVHPGAVARLCQYLDAFQPDQSFPGKGFRFVDWLAQRAEGSAAGAPRAGAERPSTRAEGSAAESSGGTIYPGDAARLYSRFSGLPEELLSDDRPLPSSEIAAALGARVIGQSQACEAAAQVLSRFKARLHDPDRPLGTLLFVGPTGVGKTELAKSLAGYLFGDERRMVRLDMSEYLSAGSAGRLIEVGQGAGSLAERVRLQPLSLILLDEIEKAHPAVFDLLLGVLGEGRLSDALGRRVDFRGTLVIMTSNLGASDTAPIGFGEREQEAYLRTVRRHFRPEFINRLDQVLVFRKLAQADLEQIVELELRKAGTRTGLERRNLRLLPSPEAKRLLARLGYHPTRGARPLRRIIEERVVTPLAVRLAREPTLRDRRIALCVEGGQDQAGLTKELAADAVLIRP